MFTADKVSFEFIADTGKLDKAYAAEARRAKRQGDKIGDQFEDGFNGEKRGRGLMAGLLRGIKKGAPAFKKGLLAATAVGAVGVGVATSFAATATAAVKAAADMKVLADTAGISAERFQELRFAASQYGIEGEKVSDILKDVNDKFGDFNATGAGPLADFFENVAPKVGLLAEDFRDLSSDQALGLYVSSLEKAGANQQDFAFFMEAIAGDATMLLPLLRDNGRELKEFSRQARDAGGVLSNEAAQGAQDADQKLNELALTLRGGLTAALVDLAPEIENITQQIIDLAPTLIRWVETAIRGVNRVVDAYDEAGKRASRIALKLNGIDLGNRGKTDIELIQRSIKLNDKLFDANEAVARLEERRDNAKSARQERLQTRFLAHAVERKTAFEDELAEIQNIERERRAANAPALIAPPPPPPPPVRVRTPAGGSGITGGGAKAIAEREKAVAKAEQEAMRAAQRRIDEAQALRDENLTAVERYNAELADIAEVAGSAMLLEVAGGDETIMRARIEALVDLAAASDDAGAAHVALAEAIEKGTLSEDAALEAATRLNSEFGLFTKAQIEARQALEDKNDELLTQIEFQRALAEASGDFTEVTRLTREIEVLRQKGDLLRENMQLTEQEAEARARADADRLAKAQDLKGFDDLEGSIGGGGNRLDDELAHIDEIEQSKLELLESYRTKETEALRDFEALKTQIEAEAEEERRAIKLAALDDQLALAEGVFGGISNLLKAAGKEDSKTAKAAAVAEKAIAIGRATVNTAVGVTKALQAPFPLNIIQAGIVGAAGAVQIATIASTGFKDGVVDLKGPGTERSDSIPANLSRGESVITARATRGNELGLARLNAGMSPEEAFGLGRIKYGFMDGAVAVGLPMSNVPSVTTPDRSAFSNMAANERPTIGGVTNHFDIKGVDTEKAFAYADRKAKETEAKVPSLTAADDVKNKRARPR